MALQLGSSERFASDLSIDKDCAMNRAIQFHTVGRQRRLTCQSWSTLIASTDKLKTHILKKRAKGAR